jgi:multidrug resistance efflux pump
MDKPRANPPKKRGKLYAAIAIVGAVGITLGLSRLKPAPPSVDNELAWRDTVELGEMVRQIRGPGTLVPEQVQIISAVTAGRIEEVPVDPGTRVTPETVLLRLTNPDEELQLLTAERNLSNSRGLLLNLRTTLESARLQQSAAIAGLQSQYDDALRQDRINEELNSKSLITKTEYETAKNNLRQLKQRLDLETKRLAVQEGTIDDQLKQQQDEINRLQQIVQFQQDRLNSMEVRAGVNGVLQRLGTTGRLEIGQYVQSGTELARVVPEPPRLKAELRIPETQVVDIAVGDSAEIDIRNGVIMGVVTRIDPAATTGTVGVDVSLPVDLPPGARPDLSVDGRIIVDRLPNVLHVGRPQHANAGATIGLFKLDPDGKTAVLTTIVVGAASVNEMEVKSGLKEGDVVILSDMSQWDSYQRIRLR